jgi:hypothetical protein
MADPRDRRKTPEEMAAIKAEVQRATELSKARKKATSDIKKVKMGQYIILGLGIIVGALAYFIYDLSGEILALYFMCGLSAIYLILGILYYKDPYVVPIIALVIYCTLLLIGMVNDPDSMQKGIGLKVLIIAGLVRAAKYGKDYKAAVKFKESDPLDQGLFEEK